MDIETFHLQIANFSHRYNLSNKGLKEWIDLYQNGGGIHRSKCTIFDNPALPVDETGIKVIQDYISNRLNSKVSNTLDNLETFGEFVELEVQNTIIRRLSNIN